MENRLPEGLTPALVLGILGLGPDGGSLHDTHMYWRKDDGRITVGYTDDMTQLRNLKNQWVPLPQYGAFQLTAQFSDHPFETLFIRGGAKELPREQIMEQGFDHSPPLVPTCGLAAGEPLPSGRRHAHSAVCWVKAKGVKFPQLRGTQVAAEPYRCQFCSGKYPTPEAVDQHTQVMHADRLQARDFRDAITTSMDRGFARVQRPMGHSAGDYACGRCGDGFASPVELTRHLKECRAVAVPGVADGIETEEN